MEVIQNASDSLHARDCCHGVGPAGVGRRDSHSGGAGDRRRFRRVGPWSAVRLHPGSALPSYPASATAGLVIGLAEFDDRKHLRLDWMLAQPFLPAPEQAHETLDESSKSPSSRDTGGENAWLA